MALNLVTFEDKQNLNTKPEIARINKVIDDDINQIKKALNELIYPVGSIIYNVSSDFDPNTVYGGTWEKIKGKMVIGYDESDDDFKTLGKTGGSKTHTQTVEELAEHNHRYGLAYGNTDPARGLAYATTTAGMFGHQSFIENTGESQPMDIMNPYYVANIWLRTA